MLSLISYATAMPEDPIGGSFYNLLEIMKFMEEGGEPPRFPEELYLWNFATLFPMRGNAFVFNKMGC